MSKKDKDELNSLNKEIERLIAEMSRIDPEIEDYAVMTARLDTLYKLKEVDHKVETKQLFGVSAETLAVISANLLGIMMIVGHERARVITSKAVSFIPKLK